MATPAYPATRRLTLVAGFAAALLGLAPPAAFAQSVTAPVVEAPAIEAPTASNPGNGLPQGALVFHGNYCGPGTRTGDLSARPVDRLDAACQIHDACYIAQHDHCDCDGALVASARAIRDDGEAPTKMRAEAALLIATFAIPVCRVFPQGFMPPRDPALLKTMNGAAG